MTETRLAAQYIRASTEHQRYSPMTQAEAIGKYAEAHGFDVVATYQDNGRSGVTLKGRDGLKQLLMDVLRKSANFQTILVLDVSRWGRFQDPDQAAHYEFLCREAGVKVRYCSEPFEHNELPTTSLIKQLKRVMAAEYSRELGTKTLAGAITGTRLGFKQGGPAIYGLRRMLVAPDGSQLMVLRWGERRGRAGDRVVYVKGPDAELRVVRRIFRAYSTGLGINAIRRELEASGVVDDAGRLFSKHRIVLILQQRLYTGIYTYNRTSQRLQSPKTQNSCADWITVRMLAPIISSRRFSRVQEMLAAGSKENFKTKFGGPYTRSDLVAHLHAVWSQNGRITHNLINSTPGPSSRAINNHFGNLQNAYLAVGFKDFNPKRFSVYKYTNQKLLDGLAQLLDQNGYLTGEMIDREASIPSAHLYRERFGGLIAAYQAVGWKRSHPLNSLGVIRRTQALTNLRTSGATAVAG